MSNAYIAGAGILCCLAGIYLFYRKVFEDEGSLSNAILLMIIGATLIGWYAAREANVIV